MAQRQLARAFDGWMQSVEDTRADAARRQHVASGVALRMAERGVCSAMATWHGVALLRRRQLRALKHWIERQLASAYGQWAEPMKSAFLSVRVPGEPIAAMADVTPANRPLPAELAGR